ncbi:MAG: hypothetical protein HOE90_17995 [Bacteriovoracaceae bacterium]|nr:hypothetical protein [Bacteriovoracaceae bacterium]
MKTCQRTIVLQHSWSEADTPVEQEPSIQKYCGKDAYIFMLEVICGLQSHVLAENEITSQFKKSFLEYIKSDHKNPLLIKIMEKLLKDAKEVRTKHLIGLGHNTYAGLTRSIMERKNKLESILILGSGDLAIDLCYQFKKKYDVYISARNPEKVKTLCLEHGVKAVPWMDAKEYCNFSHMANTLGGNQVLLDHSFFKSWAASHNKNNILVDLSSPSTIDTSFSLGEGVFRLEDLFSLGATKNKDKMDKISQARDYMKKLAQHRDLSFMLSLPFGWEELQFA